MRAVVATRASVVSHDPQGLLIVLSDIGTSSSWRTNSGRSRQRSQLGKDSERLAGERHFVIITHLHFSAGISHMRFFSSNSVHSASRNSPGRTMVKAISLSA